MGYVLRHRPAPNDCEPGRLIRLGAGEEILHIDPHRLEEAEKEARRLGIFPVPDRAGLAWSAFLDTLSNPPPRQWTDAEEYEYRRAMRGFFVG